MIIVGAGPVGLLMALRLGQAGISTLVLESHHTLLPTTCAVVYMPVVIPVLRELGILDVVLKNAFLDAMASLGETWMATYLPTCHFRVHRQENSECYFLDSLA